MLRAALIILAWAWTHGLAGGELVVEDAQVTLMASVRVPAREAGVLDTIAVREGDIVSRGALIGKLNAERPMSQEKLARYEYAIARLQSEDDIDQRFAAKSLEVAQAELQRSQASHREYAKSVSQTELDRLRLVVEKSELAIEQSTRDRSVASLTKGLKYQNVWIARQAIQRHRVTAPVAGMVVEIFHQPGEWLDPGEAVVRIVRMDRLRVEAFVDGARYDAGLRGRQVRLTTKLPPGDREGVFAGEVVFVSPEVQPVSGQVRVWAEVRNPELELRPGTRGTLTILLDDAKPANVARDGRRTSDF